MGEVLSRLGTSSALFGLVAQLVARRPVKAKVAGSIPVWVAVGFMSFRDLSLGEGHSARADGAVKLAT